MSNSWHIHCADCDVAFHEGVNHGELDLAPFLNIRPEVEAMAAVPGVSIEVRCIHLLPETFLAHRGHRLVVRSEYGYDFGECAKRVVCSCCGHPSLCRLPEKHEGDCHRGAPR